jgi:hypothetical protein
MSSVSNHFKLEEEPSVFDIAWSVGIYEGEGSATDGGGHCFQIRVGQKDPWILYKLQKLWGGSILLQKNGNTGKSYPYWLISSINAVQFTSFVYEHLSPWRQKQIDYAKGNAGIVMDFDKYHWLKEINFG